jgi:hypothetical protein
MNMQAHVVDADRFYGGALARFEDWISLIQPDDLKIRLRAVLIILLPNSLSCSFRAESNCSFSASVQPS